MREDLQIRRLESLLDRKVLPRFQKLHAEIRREIRSGRLDCAGAFWLIHSDIHGMSHWVRVACLGLRIAELAWTGKGLAEDEEALLLAAFFHDAARTRESLDTGHGQRGACLLEAFAGPLAWDPGIVAIAADAIRRHEGQAEAIPPRSGRVASALANADRLDRVRFGDRAEGSLMHPDGVWPDLQKASWALVERVDEARIREAGLLEPLATAWGRSDSG